MSPKNKILLTVGAVGVVVVFFAATSMKHWGPARAASDFDVLFKAMQEDARKAPYPVCEAKDERFVGILAELQAAGKTDLYGRGLRVLADCRMAMKRYDPAAQTLTKLMELEPQNGFRHGEIARAYSRAKKHNQAIRAAHLAVQLNPEVWQSHQLKAEVLVAAGRHAEGLESYQRALQYVTPDKQEEIEQQILRLQEKLVAEAAASGKAARDAL